MSVTTASSIDLNLPESLGIPSVVYVDSDEESLGLSSQIGTGLGSLDELIHNETEVHEHLQFEADATKQNLNDNEHQANETAANDTTDGLVVDVEKAADLSTSATTATKKPSHAGEPGKPTPCIPTLGNRLKNGVNAAFKAASPKAKKMLRNFGFSNKDDQKKEGRQAERLDEQTRASKTKKKHEADTAHHCPPSSRTRSQHKIEKK